MDRQLVDICSQGQNVVLKRTFPDKEVEKDTFLGRGRGTRYVSVQKRLTKNICYVSVEKRLTKNI